MTTKTLPASNIPSFVHLQDVSGRALRWVQPDGWKQRYELRDGENLLATMQNESFWKTSVIVKSMEGTWRLDRPGFWGSKVKVVDVTSQAELAVLYTKFSGGLLTLPDGHQLRWRSTNFWSSEWAFTNEAGIDVISFKTMGVWKSSAAISISPEAEGLPTPLLIALGWYLFVLNSWDTAAWIAVFVSIVTTSGTLR